MAAYRLSVIIPARNEVCYDIDLLHETLTNLLENTTDACQIIPVLDGYWPPTPIESHPRITVIHHSKSIGQRAATNEGVAVASGEWVCKLDAHCAVDKDFDVKLLEGAQPHWTLVPGQFNLLAFNWKCKKCGWLKDQGPKPYKCAKCGSHYFKQIKQWFPRDGRAGSDVDKKSGRRNSSLHGWRFDSNLEYQQWGALGNKLLAEQGPIHDTMSLLGACWAMRRERYLEIEPCDEKYGSWGQQGTEVSAKSWLSGGEVKVNTNTWFAHFFRVGGLWFPYPGGGHKERAMARCREMWLKNQWPKQLHPLSWLIEKFDPIPDWQSDNPIRQQVQQAGEEFYRSRGQLSKSVAISEKTVRRCALYYTCNSHDETLELAARANLKRATNGHEIGCVALQRTDFGDWTVVLQREKSGGTMHYQILAGLERSTADYVFLCESDVLYHPSHFEFTPERDDTFYYNTNVWRVRWEDGHAVRTANLQQVSGICASRKLLLDHYRKRVELIEQNNGTFDVKRMAYEPGTRGKFGDERIANWQSEFPNLDITGHGQTLTRPHFSIDSFRNKKYAEGWEETDDELPGWPKIAGRVQEFLAELTNG